MIKNKSKGTRTNQNITNSSVRLVDQNGEMVGIVPIEKALSMSVAAGLDLVEVSPNAEPPVCKILDYGKFVFEAQKKQKEAKKKQRIIHVKEIKLRVNVGEHDYMVKQRATRKFIEAGDKVKVTLRFRGREVTHKELAEDLFQRLIDDVADIGKVELQPKMEGKQLITVLAPQ